VKEKDSYILFFAKRETDPQQNRMGTPGWLIKA